MPSTNGHGPKTAILYARVSTQEQADKGYSLAQQMEALRAYAAREGYEVLEEVSDPGQSGASLERPGMDRVRDLVASEAGGVSVVLAQDRDRFAREPAYHYLLKREFEERGTRIRALNDRGDESPEGELTDGILDQLGKYERAKIAERSRRGKLRKAREGRILAGRVPDYGFAYNEARDNYVVDEAKMAVMRRIFYMVGMEGKSINAVKNTFTSEELPSPGGRTWDRHFIRAAIKDDVYRPHSHEEVAELVAPELAARLDPDRRYGVWWFNRRRVVQTQVSEAPPDGNDRRYRKQAKVTYKPREEWVAVPVPDPGEALPPREWVDAARAAIKDNQVPSSAGRRFWELSGGICYCGGCGNRMAATSVRTGRSRKLYHYYRCRARYQQGKDACAHKMSHHAHEVEGSVWEFVSGYLKNPEQLRSDLERMIEIEREGLRGDPDREAKTWLRKLAETDRKRSGYQDMAAEGLITFDELRAKLASLEETRETAERELDVLKDRRERIEQMEADRDALLEQYEAITPDALDALTPEERQEFYKMLRLKVTIGVDGTLEAAGAFFEGSGFFLSEATQSWRSNAGRSLPPSLRPLSSAAGPPAASPTPSAPMSRRRRL